MFEDMMLTTIELCSYSIMNSPFVGHYKAVVEIMGILKNVLDFSMLGLQEGEGCNGRYKEK